MTTVYAGFGDDHAVSHQNGGDDEITVQGLSGTLADAQTPAAHTANHSDGGSDEVDAGNLGSGAATIGQVLTADGAGGNSYQTPSSGGGLSNKSITLESPGAAENVTMFFTDVAITISQVDAVVRGTTPSVDFNIKHSTDRSDVTPNSVFATDQTASSTTTGDKDNTFVGGDPTIPANSWVWLTTSAVTGTVAELAVTVKFTID